MLKVGKFILTDFQITRNVVVACALPMKMEEITQLVEINIRETMVAGKRLKQTKKHRNLNGAETSGS